MEKFLRFVRGYVQISVSGEQCERFLNLCKGRGIEMRSLVRLSKNAVSGFLSVEDFRKLCQLRSKTGVHIKIRKKCGLPFFFFRNKKRKAFFVGILLSFILLALCSTRIWNIHVEGNRAYSTPEILAFLEKEGVVHGMAKKEVACGQIAAKVREAYPKITWVSARIEGTRLILTVQEGKRLTETEEENKEPCSLSAQAEGTVVKIITRKGVPLVRPGDVCKKGDVLVLGRLDIKNDSQEVVRYEYVHADADVYISRKLSYYYEFPLEYQKTVPEGTVKKGAYLKIGNWYFKSRRKKEEGWRTTSEEFPLRITENFRLPVSWGRIRYEKTSVQKAVYTPQEARAIARDRLQLYEQKLMEKGVQISQNNVKIEINHNTCVSRGTLGIIEKTGQETPVEYMEQPTERTAEDGQQYH